MQSDPKNLIRRATVLAAQARSLIESASPGPWQAHDSGYVSDKDGYVVAQIANRRGDRLWDDRMNPNTEFVTEAHRLLLELTETLEVLLDQSKAEGDRPGVHSD